jgi:hypothetical protein
VLVIEVGVNTGGMLRACPSPPPHAASNKAMTVMERNPLILLLLFILSSRQSDIWRFLILIVSCFLLVPDLLLSGDSQKRYL